MTIKNADQPASPTPYMDVNSNGGELFCDQQGLTKREVFAMHAPDVPDWFEREFSMTHSENKDYYQLHHDEFAEICPTTYQDILPKGRMALLKEWRYAYADLMLEE